MKRMSDTCSLLWTSQDSNRPSVKARHVMRNPAHTILVGVVSSVRMLQRSCAPSGERGDSVRFSPFNAIEPF